MTGLIILLILIPLALFILLITILNRSSEQQKLTESLYDRIKELSNEIAGLTKEIRNLKHPSEIKPVVTQEKPIHKIATPPPVITPKEGKPKEEKPVTAPGITKPEPVKPAIETIKEETAVESKVQPRTFEPVPKKETDLEKFIGENLASKIGIAVLVLGISFLVKYAIDEEIINKSGRVFLGLTAGAILIGIAHRIRHSYRSFSSVLMGGGLTVFYFTIAFAFHQYHLISQSVGFILMIIITAFAVLMALYYDRLELAILATIGGFITPFLVSTGQENYSALFTYLCILNSGLMVLAWFKRWPSINMIALVFTIVIYGGWLINRLWFDFPTVLPYKEAMLFASIFYVQFIAMNIINNIRQKKTFNAFDFLVVLTVNFLYYLAGLVILSFGNSGSDQGWFTGLLAGFNLLLVFGFDQKKTIDRNFIGLLTGLSITYSSLIAPVQFKGNIVTLFWAAETVILFWLFQRTRISQLKIASVIVAGLMIGSLLVTWIQVYFSTPMAIPIILNKGFSTTIAVAASLFIYYRMIYKEADSYFSKNLQTRVARNLLLGAFLVTLYLSGALEIYYQFETRTDIYSLSWIYLQLYTFVFTIVILVSFRRSNLFPILRFLLTVLCFGLYLMNINNNYEVSLALIEKNNGLLFLAHWLSVILLAWLVGGLVVFFRRREDWKSYLTEFAWLSALGIVLILSVEFYQVNLWLNYNDSEWLWWKNLYYKAGLTVLWSICSFILMWLGMEYKFRTLRIISLTLFTITLIKLFVYDITKIPAGGKIVAFILLGVLLLTVSFMYQRLKKIIIDDTGNKELSP